MTIKDYLKKLISEGWKQKDIAAKCGYKPAMINDLLKRIDKPNIQTIEKIAAAFNIRITFFLEEGEESKQRILSREEERLLQIIGADLQLLEETIKFAEKEKMYLEAKGKGKDKNG